MKWPNEIVAAFSESLDITPIADYTKEMVIQSLLDGAAKIAVKGALGNSAKLLEVYQTPFTPIGQMTANGFGNTAEKFTLKGAEWAIAVNQLYEYIEANSEEITARFVGMLNRDSGPQGTSSEAQRS